MFTLVKTMFHLALLDTILNANVAGNCGYSKPWFVGKSVPELKKKKRVDTEPCATWHAGTMPRLWCGYMIKRYVCVSAQHESYSDTKCEKYQTIKLSA